MNRELPDVQAGFRKCRGMREQTANIRWIIKKTTEFQKRNQFCFIHYAKAFDWVDHSKLWEILKKMGIPDYLTCLLRNSCAGQEASVKTGHGTTDWFQNGKGVCQGSIFKSRDITLPTKVHLVKAMVSPVVMYGCESSTIKKIECEKLMLLYCGIGEDSWESLGFRGDLTNPF